MTGKDNKRLPPMPKLGEVIVRLTANGDDPETINALLGPVERSHRTFGDHIFTHLQDSLDVTVGNLFDCKRV